MLKFIEHGDRSPVQGAYCPPAPKPQPRPLRPIALLHTLKRNPLECWAAQHFERPIVAGGLPIGHVLMVHEPRAIRRVLLDNAAKWSPPGAEVLVDGRRYLYFGGTSEIFDFDNDGSVSASDFIQFRQRFGGSI